MSSRWPPADPSPRSLRPGQFTVRLFFVAALLVSLVFASAKIVGLGLAAALVAWASLGAFYLRIRAWPPLVALSLIPAIHVLPWTIAVVAAHSHLAPAPLAVLLFFPWWFAIGLSLIVAAVDGMLLQLGRRRDRSAYGPPRPAGAGLRSSRTSYRFRWALILASTHTAVCFVALLLLLSRSGKLKEIGLVTLATLDLPIVPLYALIVVLVGADLLDYRFWTTSMPAVWLTVMCVTVGGLVYAVVGWLVGRALDRFQARQERAGARREP